MSGIPDSLLLELWPLMKEESPLIDRCIWLGTLCSQTQFLLVPSIFIFFNIFRHCHINPKYSGSVLNLDQHASEGESGQGLQFEVHIFILQTSSGIPMDVCKF